jgi:SAM-dependent methyltransferase
MEIFEEIKTCRICDSSDTVTFMDLGDQPPANSLRSALNEELPAVPLQLVHCAKCSTVQLSATVDPAFLFSHYVWVTGTSKTAHEYSKHFSSNVWQRSSVKEPFVVEIASNDGTFLKDFAEKGCKVLGVDPAKNIAEMATKAGVPTMADFFNLDTANLIKEKHGNADIVFARNVIPHVKEVHSIINGIAELLKPDGLGVIEFHYSQIILDELHYDSVYHEHLFFYSLKSLMYLLEEYDLKPFDLTKSPISGGSLVIYFSKKEKEQTTELKEALVREEKNKTNELQTWKDFAAACFQHAKELKRVVEEYKAKGTIIGYGASARSSTMLNYAGLNSEVIDYVIDKNPLKHNRYTPGTNIPIISFEEGKAMFDKCASILLLAWNFEAEIIEELRANGYKGSIIVPLPNVIRIK